MNQDCRSVKRWFPQGRQSHAHFVQNGYTTRGSDGRSPIYGCNRQARFPTCLAHQCPLSLPHGSRGIHYTQTTKDPMVLLQLRRQHDRILECTPIGRCRSASARCPGEVFDASTSARHSNAATPTGGGDLDVVQHSRGNISRRTVDGPPPLQHMKITRQLCSMADRSGGCHDAFDDDAREVIVCERIPLHIDPRSAADRIARCKARPSGRRSCTDGSLQSPVISVSTARPISVSLPKLTRAILRDRKPYEVDNDMVR